MAAHARLKNEFTEDEKRHNLIRCLITPFCRTCFSMGDLGVQVSVRLFVHLSVCPSVNIYHGCLVSTTPLTVVYWSFWNLADVFFMVWGCACGLDIIVGLFLSLFPLCELSHFSTSMYRQWAPCERNSSYNFIPIFLKLCTCFLHGLKMCIWFGYNLCIYFCYFFHFANFVIFWPQILWKCCDSGYLVSATPHTILYWSFWNFVHVFAMVWRCS